MDVPELLRRAADLVPPDARSDSGLTAEDVQEYLGHDEWEVALGILEDFDGVQWQPVEYWNLLAAAAQRMWLERDAAWCRWRAVETRSGIIKAELQLLAPDDGGRRSLVPGAGQLRPMWTIGCPNLPDGVADLHVAVIWVESAPEIRPGGYGSIRLSPLTPTHWRHLTAGDRITMHERQPTVGIATITQAQHPPSTNKRSRPPR